MGYYYAGPNSMLTQLSQESLSFTSGVQRKHISALELGDKQPTITMVFTLAKALNLTPGKLVSLVDKEYRKLTREEKTEKSSRDG